MKIGKTNHNREKIKSHITRAQRMCQTALRLSSRESEEPQKRSVRKKKGQGKRLAEKLEEPAQKESWTSSGQLARGEWNKRRPSGGLSDPDHAQSQNTRKMTQTPAGPGLSPYPHPLESQQTVPAHHHSH